MIHAAIKALFDSVLHEDADEEPLLEETLIGYVEALDVAARTELASELRTLAAADPEVIATVLDDAEFVWDLNGDDGPFLSDLAEFVDAVANSPATDASP